MHDVRAIIYTIGGLHRCAVFSVALATILLPYWRAVAQGSLVFTNSGIYNARYGLEIAWADIGPAWKTEYDLEGGSPKKVVSFLVSNASRYRARLPWFRRWLMNVRTGKHLGPVVYAEVDGVPEAKERLFQLEQDRTAKGNTAVLTTMDLDASGVSSEQIIDIINRTVLERIG